MVWAKAFDPVSGKPYFYNDETGVSVWHQPPQFAEGAVSRKLDAAIAIQSMARSRVARARSRRRRERRDRWARAWDPTSQSYYYYETATGESQWDRPSGFVPGARDRRLGAATRIQGMFRARVARQRLADRRELQERYTECFDPNSNRVYYYDSEQDESLWDRPADFIAGGVHERVKAALLVQRAMRRKKAVVAANKIRRQNAERERRRQMWIKTFDPESRRPYYYNTLTSKSVFVAPGVYVPGGTNERIDAAVVLQCAIRNRRARDELWFRRSMADARLWHRSCSVRHARRLYWRNAQTKVWQWEPAPPAYDPAAPGRCGEMAAAEAIQRGWRTLVAWREAKRRREALARRRWVEQFDPVAGRPYYYDTQERSFFYERPRGFVKGGSNELLDAARCIQNCYRRKMARRRLRALMSGFVYGDTGTGPALPPPVSRLFRRTGVEMRPGTEIYMVDPDNQTQGPFSVSLMRRKWRNDDVGPDTLVWVPGLAGWSPLRALPPVMRKLRAPSPPPAVDLTTLPLQPGSTRTKHMPEKLRHMLLCALCGVVASWRCTVCNEPVCFECFQEQHKDDAEKDADLDVMGLEEKLERLAMGSLRLEELDLRGQVVTGARCAALGAALGGGRCTLRQLDVSGDALGNSGCEALAVGLAHNNVLRELALGYNEIGDAGAAALADALAHNTALLRLDMSFNRICGEGTAALARMLRTNEALRWLSLNNNPVGDAGARALAAALLRGATSLSYADQGEARTNGSLASLLLGYCGIGEAAMTVMAETLKMTASLTEFDIGYNALSVNAARALGSAFVQYPSLQVLGCCFCSLGSEGTRAIVAPLRANHIVTALDLSFNDLGPEGARHVFEALRRNRGVTRLNLAHNGLGPRGAELVGHLLEANAVLESVDVSHNELTTEGVEELARGLGKCKVDSLRLLDLSHNGVAIAGGRALDGATRFNPNLSPELEIIMVGNVGDPNRGRKVSIISIKPMEEETWVEPAPRSPAA